MQSNVVCPRPRDFGVWPILVASVIVMEERDDIGESFMDEAFHIALVADTARDRKLLCESDDVHLASVRAFLEWWTIDSQDFHG